MLLPLLLLGVCRLPKLLLANGVGRAVKSSGNGVSSAAAPLTERLKDTSGELK